MSWQEQSRASLLETLLNRVSAGTTLRQCANWHALFVGFPPLAREVHWETALMEKGYFPRFFCSRCLKGM